MRLPLSIVTQSRHTAEVGLPCETTLSLAWPGLTWVASGHARLPSSMSLSDQIKEQKYGDVVQILSMELQSHPKVPPTGRYP